MKTLRFILFTLLLLGVKLGTAQTTTNSLSVSPNPFKTTTTIHFEIANDDTVSNLSGQLCKTITTNTTSISLSDLSEGIYIINVFSEDNNLLKNHQNPCLLNMALS